MENKKFIEIDNREVEIEDERNILELARKANIDIPTFCYHSELSIYGACRLCMVEIEGRGLTTSCSTKPEPGMKVKTNTRQLREIRKTIIELILANHDKNCPTCQKNQSCKLQDLARRFDIDEISFKQTEKDEPKDESSHALIRDPNKCILCGDCVRMCNEIQGIGALDFAYRGAKVQVLPAFGHDISDVDCVNCGQCARVCPTGAIVPKKEIDEVWEKIDGDKMVVAQIAPAVRVALGEYFGKEPGEVSTGQIVSALKMLGIDKVYDTSFTADLTVLEEGAEFLERLETDENLPQFTSCCPGWVKFAEQYFPELLDNISSCKSPQQMFGSLAKKILPEKNDIEEKDLSVISIMPCTAKKYEATREELKDEIDNVITTQELGLMIEQAGIDFNSLEPESLDMPFGFKTGGGIIFGNSGGVSEAVLRYVSEKVTGKKSDSYEYRETRGEEGIREITVNLDDKEINMAIVYGLANAKKLAKAAMNDKCKYDFIEVMACPGGCIGGAGQPVTYDLETIKRRGESLYQIDKSLHLHKPQENPYITECYDEMLDEIGSKRAHELLHTKYYNKQRISKEGLELIKQSKDKKIEIGVCVGTNCYVKGSQELLRRIMQYIQKKGYSDVVDAQATFCFENCSQAPVVRIGDELINGCTFDKAINVLEEQIKNI